MSNDVGWADGLQEWPRGSVRLTLDKINFDRLVGLDVILAHGGHLSAPRSPVQGPVHGPITYEL